MNDPARATCHYIDHDGLIQTKAAKGSSDLQASFGIAMADGSTRIYARAGVIGGEDEVTYSVPRSQTTDERGVGEQALSRETGFVGVLSSRLSRALADMANGVRWAVGQVPSGGMPTHMCDA